jgi:hypothetical protein
MQAYRMRAIDVSLDDVMVVDNQGTVWVADESDGGQWSYLTEGFKISWDKHRELPEQYEPYVVLDDAARTAIQYMVN